MYTRILTRFYFSSVLTQMWGKNLHRKIFSQLSMHVAFLPLPVLGTVNFVAVGSSIISSQLVAGSIMVRHMKLILVLSLPLRVYCPMRSTLYALQGVIMTSFDGERPYFWLCLLFYFLAGSAKFHVWLDGIVHTFPVYHWFHCLFETWVARVLEVVVIPTHCSMP